MNELAYDVTVDDLETIGERAWTMTRLFNLREGFDREDDELPTRFTRPLERAGPAEGNAISEAEFETMLEAYYDQRGWTSEGVPTTETLERLDLAAFEPAAAS